MITMIILEGVLCTLRAQGGGQQQQQQSGAPVVLLTHQTKSGGSLRAINLPSPGSSDSSVPSQHI